MQLEVQKCLYKIQEPIDTDRISKDLTKLRKELAPGKYDKDQLVNLIEELDKYIVTQMTPEPYIYQMFIDFYKDSIPNCDTLTMSLNQFNFELLLTAAEAVMVLNVDQGDIPLEDYLNHYEDIQDEILLEYDDYVDLEHLLADVVILDSIELSPSDNNDEEFFEYTGANPKELEVLENMKLMDSNTKVYANDCQEILLPELMTDSCVHTGDGNINYYRICKLKSELIGG